MEQHQEIEVKPEEGYLPGWLYRAKIFDLDCYVVVPEVPSYPKDVLEVIAPENIRKKYKIKDGDAVTVLVTVSVCCCFSFVVLFNVCVECAVLL